MGRLTSDGFQPARHNPRIERPAGRMVAKATRMPVRNEREATPPFLSSRGRLGGRAEPWAFPFCGHVLGARSVPQDDWPREQHDSGQ